MDKTANQSAWHQVDFEDVSYIDWSSLNWNKVNRPYKVDKWAKGKRFLGAGTRSTDARQGGLGAF